MNEWLYEFGRCGFTELFLYGLLGDTEISVAEHVIVRNTWEDVEDRAERIIGEARDNFAEL